jgi:hypothetical protein
MDSPQYSMKPRMTDVNTHLIFDILLLVGVVLTLFMAWATHRKIKEHAVIIGAVALNLIALNEETATLKDRLDVMAPEGTNPPTPPAPPAPPAPGLKQSGTYLNASGEMCNQIRGPWGVKEDCRPPSTMYGGRASLPTPKQLEMKSKY